MGQYGNQPDFGTRAKVVEINANPTSPDGTYNLNSAALYIGTGGTLVCRVVGGNAFDYGSTESGYTIFTNIPSGTFFPVIVDTIWTDDGDIITTTCGDIVALY